MSLGTKQNLDSMFLAQTTSTTYEALEDKPKGDHSVVHEEFIERPSCSAESRFLNRPFLERRLSSLTRQQVGKLEAFCVLSSNN